MTDPDVIRAQIEQTRLNLSDDVNQLADTVNPTHVAKRQVDKVKGAVGGVKEKVMGTASDAGSNLASTQSSVADAVSGAVTGAPGQVRMRAAGNPLAAGLIAVGVGWLIGSLLPASTAEQQAAAKVKDTATPVLTDAAKEVAGNLQEPAQQAVAAVKDTATDAATTVKDESTAAANDLKDQAHDAKGTVQESITS
jgi:ElaB/YqjD/DUF883 family membrane-anchored ribosome-binding protein